MKRGMLCTVAPVSARAWAQELGYPITVERALPAFSEVPNALGKGPGALRSDGVLSVDTEDP
jgi:hypothetical protein